MPCGQCAEGLQANYAAPIAAICARRNALRPPQVRIDLETDRYESSNTATHVSALEVGEEPTVELVQNHSGSSQRSSKMACCMMLCPAPILEGGANYVFFEQIISVSRHGHDAITRCGIRDSISASTVPYPATHSNTILRVYFCGKQHPFSKWVSQQLHHSFIPSSARTS